LIYKSVREALQAHEGSKLFCLPSLFLGEDAPRSIFVSADVFSIVEGPWAETSDGRRHANLRSLFDGFTDGDRFTMADDPFKKPSHSMIARVAPIESEVFDFRCLDPNPGIRAFGRFAEQDIFVALTWNYRENISGREDWSAEVESCITLWQELFDNLPPHKGRTVNDYITYNACSV
jgi:hypothetical protein